MDWSKIKYFKEEEFECHHCGDANMDFTFVSTLDVLRDRLGAPIKVTSGYRCPAHNAAVSATGAHGPHTTGMAGDIQTVPEKMRDLVTLAVELFPGVGFQLKGEHQTRYIHVDTLKPRAWSY